MNELGGPAAPGKVRAIGCPDIHAMCLAHFNEPLIVGFEVGRLIGYGEDEMDCYLMVQFRGGKISWCTAVGGYHFLDRLRGQDAVQGSDGKTWDELSRIDNFLALNGSPPADVFALYFDEPAEGGLNQTSGEEA